jgi:ribosome biogenesis GTPase A
MDKMVWRSGRTSFSFAGAVNWFPGHMAKATRLMRERLNSGGVDVVLEVRDARIPFSAANSTLEGVLAQRHIPRILILHKADLTNHNLLPARHQLSSTSCCTFALCLPPLRSISSTLRFVLPGR